MRSEYFSEKEAESKVNKLVVTLREFSGIPKHTAGKVTRVYGDKDKYGVDIEWQLIHEKRPRYKPIVDGFSKSEYEEFLQEINL